MNLVLTFHKDKGRESRPESNVSLMMLYSFRDISTLISHVTECCCYSLYMKSDLNIVLGTAVASLS